MTALDSFRNRKPVAACLVAAVLSPVVGMLYLARWRWALSYSLLQVLIYGAALAAVHFDVTTVAFDLLASFGILFLHGIGTVHAFYSAKSFKVGRAMPWYSSWKGMVAIFVSMLAAAFLLRFFAFEPFSTPQMSMYPTLRVGDHFFVRKFGLTHRSGDLIVFRHQRDGKEAIYIKRIIGVSGDEIEFKPDGLFINNARVVLKEDFLELQAQGWGQDIVVYDQILPDGKSHKISCKSKNPPLCNSVIAAQQRYTVRKGQYFVMGDNRDVSLDSRTKGFGFVFEDQIVGTPSFVYWNAHEQKVHLRWLD